MLLTNMVLAALAVGFAGAAMAADAPPADVPSESYTHPQQLVAINGGRHLNLFCLGSGSPTVLFEAGSGSNSSTWRYVQGQVATFTRACSYDRAGLGFSDPPGRDVDARNVVEDLQSLVVAAPIATPIVFVGHSIGGLYGSLFGATHKDEVAGMVLVDPSFAHQFENFAAGSSGAEVSALYTTFRGMTDDMRACQLLVSRAPAGKPPSAKEAECLPSAAMPDHPDAVLLAALTQQWLKPAPYSTLVSEGENFIPTSEGGGHPAPDDDELDSASGNLGDMPLVVLTAGRTMATFPGLSADQRLRFAAAWTAGHVALAHRSTRGESQIVPDSAHFIQIEQPVIVVDAVRRVVDKVRAGAVAH